jgi:hypothetical protein
MTHTAATGRPAYQAPAQDTHHYILTLQKPLAGAAWETVTAEGTCTPAPGITRHQLYQMLLADTVRQRPDLQGAPTIFFDLQSNRL